MGYVLMMLGIAAVGLYFSFVVPKNVASAIAEGKLSPDRKRTADVFKVFGYVMILLGLGMAIATLVVEGI
jgi:hypothetical protein